MKKNHELQRAHSSFAGWIGVARKDITPPVGIYARNWGAALHETADSIHGSLTLTVMTLSPGPESSPVIFVDADIGLWRSLEYFREFQTEILERFDVEPASLIFALSHTHSAPPLMTPDKSMPGNDLIEIWLKEVKMSILETTAKALNTAFAGCLDWHAGRCALAAVRDLPDPSVDNHRIVCGYNPEVPADDTLIVGRITDRTQRIRGTLVNYACHPTTLAWENTAISPDYIGAMRHSMEVETGAPAMFMLGSCGDLGPKLQYVGDPAVADRHGRQLAFASLATLNDMEPPATRLVFDRTLESGAPLAIWGHETFEPPVTLRAVQCYIEMPLKDWPGAEELEAERVSCTDRALKERLRRKRDIRLDLGDSASFRLPYWVWRIGDAVLVGCCCESYSMLQVELRKRFPGRVVLCMNLINGSIGYLPPKESYDDDIYQVWQTPFAQGGLEKLIDAMTIAIQEVLDE